MGATWPFPLDARSAHSSPVNNLTTGMGRHNVSLGFPTINNNNKTEEGK
jgi:hypothetical protein